MMSKASKAWPDLPPPVAAHVQRQLCAHDWDRLLSDLRTLCADLPSRPRPRYLYILPFSGHRSGCCHPDP